MQWSSPSAPPRRHIRGRSRHTRSDVGRHGSRTPPNAKPPIKDSVFATTKTMPKSSRMTAMVPRRRIVKVKRTHEPPHVSFVQVLGLILIMDRYLIPSNSVNNASSVLRLLLRAKCRSVTQLRTSPGYRAQSCGLVVSMKLRNALSSHFSAAAGAAVHGKTCVVCQHWARNGFWPLTGQVWQL
jgi:hypothetical protein